LFDIDTLDMFSGPDMHKGAQLKLAQAVMTPALQADYNQIKGSVPALRNPDFSKMDSCARDSWKTFARGPAAQVPSFSHHMATDETSRDAIIGELHRFFMDDGVAVADTVHRFETMAHVLTKIGMTTDNAQDTHR
jgi:glucose/mannose transport system substrate-binding protein